MEMTTFPRTAWRFYSNLPCGAKETGPMQFSLGKRVVCPDAGTVVSAVPHVAATS